MNNYIIFIDNIKNNKINKEKAVLDGNFIIKIYKKIISFPLTVTKPLNRELRFNVDWYLDSDGDFKRRIEKIEKLINDYHYDV